MSDCLGIRFRPGVPAAMSLNDWMGDGKWFGRCILQLDGICEIADLPAFSRFWPEAADRVWFNAAEGLLAIQKLLPWLDEEKDSGLIFALSLLANDLEIAREKNAQFVLYHY